MHKAFRCSQWRNGTRFELNVFREKNWQFFVWYELFTTFIAIYNRNWHAPITLARDKPIAKTEISFTFTDTAFVKCSCNIFTSLFRCLTIKFARINQHAIFVVRFFPCIEIVAFTIVRNNRFNRQIVFMSKFPVPFIMCRRTHNGTSTIIYENIVSNPNWHLFARHRVYCIRTSKHTFLRSLSRGAVNITHITHTSNKSFKFSFIRRILDKAFHIRMFRCQYNIAYTIDCIYPCSINGYALINRRYIKGEFCTFRATNPVFLHQFNALWPAIKGIEIIQ